MSYVFKMWASNKFGAGKPSTLQVTTLPPSTPTDLVNKMVASSGQDKLNSAQALWVMTAGVFVCTIVFLAVICCILLYIEGKITWFLPEYVEEMIGEDTSGNATSDDVHVIENPAYCDLSGSAAKAKVDDLCYHHEMATEHNNNFIEVSLANPTYLKYVDV